MHSVVGPGDSALPRGKASRSGDLVSDLSFDSSRAQRRQQSRLCGAKSSVCVCVFVRDGGTWGCAACCGPADVSLVVGILSL